MKLVEPTDLPTDMFALDAYLITCLLVLVTQILVSCQRNETDTVQFV